MIGAYKFISVSLLRSGVRCTEYTTSIVYSIFIFFGMVYTVSVIAVYAHLFFLVGKASYITFVRVVFICHNLQFIL
jgi:hypothetical protein